MAVTVEHRADLILICFSEAVSSDDLFEVAERLDQIDNVAPGLPRLADATRITGITLDFSAMARFADDRKRWSLARHVRTAVLAGSNVTFGFARMYQDLLENPQITVGVFRDREEALSWLGVHAGADDSSSPAGAGGACPSPRAR
jgi:hypothetical protein